MSSKVPLSWKIEGFISDKVPWAWQINALAYATRNILATVADCGVGKTLFAIMVALIKNKPVIVIAPTRRLCAQWKDDIEKSVANADVWLYSKPEETKQGVKYQERFEQWLTEAKV